MSDRPVPSTDATPLLTAARAMHEMFKTYLAAGFNERQALILTAETVAQAGKNKQ